MAGWRNGGKCVKLGIINSTYYNFAHACPDFPDMSESSEFEFWLFYRL